MDSLLKPFKCKCSEFKYWFKCKCGSAICAECGGHETMQPAAEDSVDGAAEDMLNEMDRKSGKKYNFDSDVKITVKEKK
jgi:hypothetical protein